MTEAVFDFAAINRRLNRKPEGLPVFYSDEISPDQVANIDAMLGGKFAQGEFVAVESETDALMAVLRVEVEWMERELLRLDEVMTRACPR